MTYAIETQGLTRRLDRRTAVTGLTLQVPAGSGFTLLGPNGAGKTTSLKEFRKRLGSQGIYRGSFLVDLDQLTVAATLPLQASVTYQGRRKRLIIDQIVAQGRAATIRLRHITSTSIFDSDAVLQISYYLRNRTTPG
jgi:ABC-type cobalamin/Fe3+-siderophores transport system ATPase subunit